MKSAGAVADGTRSGETPVPGTAGEHVKNAAGTLVVPGAGHFLQWERADLLNQALKYFLRPRA